LSQLPRLSSDFTPSLSAYRHRPADVHDSISDSFEMHYKTHGTDHHTERDPSGAGVSFATGPCSPIQTVVTTADWKTRNRQMPHSRLPLNEVLGAEIESSAASQPAPQGGTSARAAEGPERESGFALEDGPNHAYNEEAFQYFLEIERKRSEHSNRPFLLMLVDFSKPPRIDGVTADRLFSVLSECLRDTDFIGWYREGRVAGAVLTQHGEADGDDLSEVVRQRIAAALRRALPIDLARQLQTRVYQIPPHVKSGSK